MKDMLTIICEKLLQESLIETQVTEERIAYYNYGNDKDNTKPFIIIIPMGPPLPGKSGSNQELNVQHTIQIDVQARDRKVVKEIQGTIKKVMKELNFVQLREGLDEWLADVERFVDARRYRAMTKLYDNNY